MDANELKEVHRLWLDLDSGGKQANLEGANLLGAKGLTEQPLHTRMLPESGSFIGFKKVQTADGSTAILKLQILENGPRTSNISNRKCRAAKVLDYDCASGIHFFLTQEEAEKYR